MPPSASRPAGLFAFTLVWLGQIVSVLATNMTEFGLTIWVYERTGSATALGLMQVFFLAPAVALSPLAGVLVDRYNRKWMMMVSDLGAGLSTIALLILQALGALQLWHLYVAAVINGLSNTFQWPAYSAAISTMVPKEHYGRANGMMSLTEVGPGVLAPLMAGALLPLIHLTGLMLIDVLTFLFALSLLLLVHIPQPPRAGADTRVSENLWKESLYGFQYILRRPSLLWLQCVFLWGNLCVGLGFTVFVPMILARTGQDTLVLGSTQSVGALGGVVGGIVMSVWGGPKRRVHGVLLGWALLGLVCQATLGLGRSLPVWALAMFAGTFLVPIIDGSNQSIWQAKVAPEVQGRVFAARRMIAGIASPVAPLVAGPLADFVLEPAMQAGSNLTGVFGWLVGAGPGAGMALWLVFTGTLAAVVGLGSYLFPVIRNAEDLLPDHQPDHMASVPAPT